MTEARRTIDTLIEPRWLVPVEPHGVVLDDHAVAIDGGKIIAVLPIADAQSRFAPRERIELR